MAWSADDERRVALALADARDRLVYKGRDPKGGDVVFETICTACEIERRMRVGGGPQGDSSPWPYYTRTPEEHQEDLKQRMIEIAAGDPVDVVFGVRILPTPKEIALMESINRVFRNCLVGTDHKRDWLILHLFATPKATPRRVGKIVGRSHRTVSDRKKMQCDAIWARLRHLINDPSSKRSGIVWERAA